jgi:uncharacterized alkaline shock family protein YloU
MAPSTRFLPSTASLSKGELTMPEIINSLFGRTRNDTPGSREYVASSTAAQTGDADVPVADETVDTTAIEVVVPTGTATVEPTGDTAATEDVADSAETAPSADDVAEPTEEDAIDHNPADSDSENSDDVDDLDDADDLADDDTIAGDATSETAAEEAATDEDPTGEAAPVVADEDDESAADIEPVAVEADDAPVAAETDADDVDQTEPVVEPVTAETRPAADKRGSVTVADGVVAKVVNIVVRKVDGVHSLDDEGISIEVDDEIATIKVSLVVEYGHAIKPLAERIRVDVIEAVEQFLGLDVAAVDVHVTDIHPPAAV